MIEAVGEWGEELERILADEADDYADPMARFEATWTQVISSFEAHRPVLVASFEAFVRSEHSPELRERIVAGQEEARVWLARLFADTYGPAGGGGDRAVGSFYLALLNGLMVQWFADPERAPSGGEMAEALRTIMGSIRPAERRYTPPSA